MSEKRRLVPFRVGIEKLGCKTTKAYKLIGEGVILAYQMGGQTMLCLDSIEAYHGSLPRIMPQAAPAPAAPAARSKPPSRPRA
jgi:hypothetical protein